MGIYFITSNMENKKNKEKHFNLYRISKLGETLALTLDSLVDNGEISNLMAFKIMEQFDKSIYEALKNRTNAKAVFRGRVEKYNYLQNIWIYNAKDVLLSVEIRKNKLEREIYNLKIDKAKITCVDERLIDNSA